MHKRSILVIAPDLAEFSLPQKTIEIASIQRYHEVRVLAGIVRDVDITQAVADCEYEIIWFISHGGADGIMLSASTLATDAVVQYVKASSARLCILNTCASEETALQIAAYSGSDVICTVGPIDNHDALRLGSLLAGELAFVTNYRDAFDIVATPESSYRYYEASSVSRGYRNEEYDELLRLYYRMEADVRVMRWQNLGLTVLVLIETYLLWMLYSKVGGL